MQKCRHPSDLATFQLIKAKEQADEEYAKRKMAGKTGNKVCYYKHCDFASLRRRTRARQWYQIKSLQIR